jgi:tRNA threonylcarbamoyl adenosine modification protein YeaZ
LALDNVVKHVSCEKQSVELSATVEKFLNGNFKDLTAIGVVVGPGSFTGIRLGIAYAKGLSVGLNIPVIPITGFEIYMADAPDAFVAIDSKRGDFFVASAQHAPGVMTIDEVESEQMKCARTVGHKPYDLANALQIVKQKLNANEPVIPMYLKNHYAEKSASVNCECE